MRGKCPGVLLMMGVVVLMAGCVGDRGMYDLKTKLENIRRKPPGRVDPPPKFKTYENFIYSATLLRSPFQPPLVEEEVRVAPQTGRKVQPDPYRQKEVLEDFSLEALSMVGTIQRDGEGLYALVKDNKLVIHRVLPGNYMGRNHGKILNVSPGKIDLVELVPDGQGGWVERPRSILLKNE